MKKLAIVVSVMLMNTSQAVTVRDNLVVFFPQKDHPALSLGFSLESYVLTDGQPWGGFELLDGNTINIKAGRKNSSKVANWVEANITVPYRDSNALSDTGGLPKELNFAVKGSLTFFDALNVQTLNCPNIILAQGHYVLTNNWWIFSNYDNQVKCTRSCILIKCFNIYNPSVAIPVQIDQGKKANQYIYSARLLNSN